MSLADANETEAEILARCYKSEEEQTAEWLQKHWHFKQPVKLEFHTPNGIKVKTSFK